MVQFIEKGKRLRQPEKCPATVYRVMMQCWAAEPDKRPTFQKLNQHFQEDPLYEDVRALMKSRENSDK